MPDKKVKFTRWFLGLVFLISVVLDNIWRGGENQWAYWISRLLSGGEIAVFGLTFLFFPYFMLRVLGSEKEDLKDNPKWLFITTCSILGISIALIGINFLVGVIGRWLTECNILLCLPSVP
jgi:hypothetical protein